MNRRELVEARVARTRKSKLLDRLAPPLVSDSQGMWSMWLDIVPYVGIAAGIVAYVGGRTQPRYMLSAITFTLFAVAWFARPVEHRIHARTRKKGQVVRTKRIMVNDNWFDSENEKPWPAFVLLSFDADLANDAQRMEQLAERLFELKCADRSRMPQDLAAVAWCLYQEMNHERVAVPLEFAGAKETYVCSTMLPPGCEDDDGFIWVLALREESHPAATIALPGGMVAQASRDEELQLRAAPTSS